MNLERINQLKGVIYKLGRELAGLYRRRVGLENSQVDVNSMESRRDAFIRNAGSLVESLGGFGFREEFLEQLLEPLHTCPRSQDVAAAMRNELDDISKKIQEKEQEKSNAQLEEQQLEMESV